MVDTGSGPRYLGDFCVLPFGKLWMVFRLRLFISVHFSHGDALRAALEAFYGTLDRISVEDLVKDNGGLQAVLAVPGP